MTHSETIFETAMRKNSTCFDFIKGAWSRPCVCNPRFVENKAVIGALWRYLKRYFGNSENILKIRTVNGAFCRYLIRCFVLQWKLEPLVQMITIQKSTKGTTNTIITSRDSTLRVLNKLPPVLQSTPFFYSGKYLCGLPLFDMPLAIRFAGARVSRFSTFVSYSGTNNSDHYKQVIRGHRLEITAKGDTYKIQHLFEQYDLVWEHSDWVSDRNFTCFVSKH